ncbi:5-bromo-4-chloroindolyl phosphate hydrolysis family protein [Macrococcus capreoli]|uniref:5-bromo-4-chloroindolyl phosphate hydrolysis family protein n=1 Tax=Macrococcus capreoli TaxID=2982690 RepID=UPI0021D613B4|nr:5-bromo-4-chloroindolyl phosphate hydrolysis family protein [Macrococcus sp. TMW 2.2395]MCU7556692.1 5-bromo-4-chloroindolyl phosphate hydrolysis family protein [Macrococcus sp. TMW 2.2395]
MKYNASYIFGAIFAVPIAMITGFISMQFFHFDMWIDMLVMIAGYFSAYLPIQTTTGNKYLKAMGITKQEYKYIRKEMKQAEPKIKHLLIQYKKVRSINDFRNVNEINKLARTIYKAVQKDPKKFFKVGSFFFSHLENTVNLLDQFLYLSRMPHKTQQDKQLLYNAQLTLEELKRTLQADLKALNSADYEQMKVEIDIAALNKSNSNNAMKENTDSSRINEANHHKYLSQKLEIPVKFNRSQHKEPIVERTHEYE